MIEYLFPDSELQKVKPPKMKIGEFYTFKGNNNLLGVGSQAVHNSGSSMLLDTPLFKWKVISFIDDHFKYSNSENNANIPSFIEEQVDSLLRFKSDKQYRAKCIADIFDKANTLSFSSSIKAEYLYISLILFFVKEFNFFRSKHRDHVVTKKNAQDSYKSEAKFIEEYVYQLQKQPNIKYLSDVCFGRYYFLEVHFSEKVSPRNVPTEIVKVFLHTQKKHSEDFDLIEQRDIQTVTGLNADELERENNRIPTKIDRKKGQTYKTNPRLAKTVLARLNYKCEINNRHMTFFTKKGIQFSESHHLLPMSFQDRFLPLNIDREENITSLCPTCHRAVHLGNESEKRERLLILYNSKHESLESRGIKLSFEELLSLYI